MELQKFYDFCQFLEELNHFLNICYWDSYEIVLFLAISLFRVLTKKCKIFPVGSAVT